MKKSTRKRQLAAQMGNYIKRIVAAWHASNESHLSAGIAWYDRAQDAAREMHPNILISAGVIAALSPRCAWGTNKDWAKQVIDAAQSGAPCPNVHTQVMRTKAWKIATLENPTAEAIVKILNGPKVTRFFKNIIGDTHAVTVDVWAARVATGKESKSAPAGQFYLMVERAYQRAAAIIGRAARDVQAAVWVSIRGTAI